MTMTYTGKIRAKDINTGKVKYFDRTSPIPENYIVVSICRQSASNAQRPQPSKWLTLYKKLIKHRLTTPLEEIYDNEVYQHHHIYPKSIYGKNDKVVLLTVFEHCCVHYWLAKHYKSVGRLEDANKMFAAYAHLRADCGISFDVSGHKQFSRQRMLLERDLLNTK